MKIRQTSRFYPTERQCRQLARDFGCTRHAYNYALKLRTDSFKDGKRVNYNASSAAWTAHRSDVGFLWLRESSCVPQQQALRHLQTAFSNFFAKRAKYPTFKSKHGEQSAEHTARSFKWDAANQNLTVSGLGRLNITFSQAFTSEPTTVTITKDRSGRYFVTMCLDEVKTAMPQTGLEVGVDLGISRLATLSNGEHVPNARHTVRGQAKLAKLQRVLARRVKGSHRRALVKRKVARHHAHIASARKDTMDKLTTDLVRRFDVIAIEDLNVRGMVKNHCLAKHISCAGFGMFQKMLAYKAGWYGKEVRMAGRFFPSSKRCSGCGFVHATMPLDVREFSCEQCGTRHDRDENAAKNILKFAEVTLQTTAGQAGSDGRGENVSPKIASVVRGSSRRSVNQLSAENVEHVPLS